MDTNTNPSSSKDKPNFEVLVSDLTLPYDDVTRKLIEGVTGKPLLAHPSALKNVEGDKTTAILPPTSHKQMKEAARYDNKTDSSWTLENKWYRSKSWSAIRSRTFKDDNERKIRFADNNPLRAIPVSTSKYVTNLGPVSLSLHGGTVEISPYYLLIVKSAHCFYSGLTNEVNWEDLRKMMVYYIMRLEGIQNPSIETSLINSYKRLMYFRITHLFGLLGKLVVPSNSSGRIGPVLEKLSVSNILENFSELVGIYPEFYSIAKLINYIMTDMKREKDPFPRIFMYDADLEFVVNREATGNQGLESIKIHKDFIQLGFNPNLKCVPTITYSATESVPSLKMTTDQNKQLSTGERPRNTGSVPVEVDSPARSVTSEKRSFDNPPTISLSAKSKRRTDHRSSGDVVVDLSKRLMIKEPQEANKDIEPDTGAGSDDEDLVMKHVLDMLKNHAELHNMYSEAEKTKDKEISSMKESMKNMQNTITWLQSEMVKLLSNNSTAGKQIQEARFTSTASEELKKAIELRASKATAVQSTSKRASSSANMTKELTLEEAESKINDNPASSEMLNFILATVKRPVPQDKADRVKNVIQSYLTATDRIKVLEDEDILTEVGRKHLAVMIGMDKVMLTGKKKMKR